MELLPHRLTDIFSTEVVLENDRVLLRPLQQQDVYLLLPFAEQEPEIWKYSAVTAAGKDGMCEYVNTALQMRDAGKEYPFIVFDKQSDSYAGCTRFYDINPDFSTIQLGYTWYGKSFQATGLNRNCKLLMLSFAFEEWNMERVEFRADNRNERSIQAMKNIGCTVEGVLRSNMPTSAGGRRDSIVLSILRNEWFGSVKKKLEEKIH